ncbi:AAA family ATPase [Listeria monocytogenes]|nr:AAA family ATPase [Listeria monocytogenes]EJT0856706.1 AAA family ATPase [Listeria monocytogenes]EKB6620180.1 AAA family ATPase [Listeria monocytogenes]
MIKNEIVEWVKELPYWQQVAGDAILSGKDIDELLIEKIYHILKQKNDLEIREFEDETLNFLTMTNSAELVSKMRWDKLSDVKGVNALKSDTTIQIGEQLTVIYGVNGSGKSGYTRLLNNAFTSRGDKKILSNIYDRQENIKPSAKFVFCDDEGEKKELLFPDDSSNELFSKVSVFDSKSATEDLTKGVELDFKPIEFNFFDKFVEVISDVKTKLNEDIKQRRRDNIYVSAFGEDTEIRRMVSGINGKTEIDVLIAASQVSDLENTYESNLQRKSKLQALNIEEKTSIIEKQKVQLNRLKDKIRSLNEKLSDDRIAATKQLIEEVKTLRKISTTEGIVQLEGENIYQLGSPEWKAFIESAKTYYDSIPEEVEHCIFCGQSIDYITVIDKYWTFLKSQAEADLNKAKDDIENLIKYFKEVDCKLILEESSLSEWLNSEASKLYNELILEQKQMGEIKKSLIASLSQLKWDNEIASNVIKETICDDTSDLLENKLKELNKQDVDIELKEINKFENEYNAKVQLNNLLPKITKLVRDLNWADKADLINNSISTSNLTKFQKKMFNKYVNDTYIQRFKEECGKLNIEFLGEVKQVAKKGITLEKLTIKGKQPIEILSEGEQRAIAIANFLTETSLSELNTCVVFDDPVCSLDYQRRNEIAKRLINLATEKQVVIFTHDITLLYTLQDGCNNEMLDCSIIPIKKYKNVSGITHEHHPWIGMNVKKRKGYLKNQLQDIKAFYSKIDETNINAEEEYIHKAKYWCEQLRETWERSVEEIVLNGAIVRFDEKIQTLKLKKVNFNFEKYKMIDIGMSTCSDWTHDRASGLGEQIPNPDELQSYLDSFVTFVNENKI